MLNCDLLAALLVLTESVIAIPADDAGLADAGVANQNKLEVKVSGLVCESTFIFFHSFVIIIIIYQ